MKNSEPESAFALIAGCARSAFSVKALAPVWLWLLAIECLEDLALAGAARWAAWLIFAVGCFPIAAWTSLCSVRCAASRQPFGLGEVAVGTRRALVPLVLSAAFTLLTPTLILALALAGSVVGQIPWVGRWILGAWMASGGLLLSFLAAAWIVVGVPAVLLQAAAAVAEFPDAMDIASRTLSYVRRRPLLLAASWLGAMASALAGTAAFGIFVSLAIGSLIGIDEVGRGILSDPSTILAKIDVLWRDPRASWPFARLFALVPLTGGAHAQSPAWALLLAGIVPAFFVAAAFSGMARVYLVLRREVDGVPVTKIYGG